MSYFAIFFSANFALPLNHKFVQRNVVIDSFEQLQYRSKILGPKYAHKTRLRVKHARVCVFDTRMRYAQKANSLVFMS